MNVHLSGFAIAVSLFLLLMFAATLLLLWRAQSMNGTEANLQDFLGRLRAVDRHTLEAVALASSDADEMDADRLWDMIGGLDGLEKIAENCDVLIQLAFHVQQYYPEALAVAEQLRLSAREIQWHLERLRGAQGRGNLRSVFPDYAQRAVEIYYGMTQHVLSLYKTQDLPEFAQLAAVL